LLERHIRRFDGCSTAEFARRRLAELVLSADGPVEAPPISEEDRKRFDQCDLLAASDLDRDRPAGVPGLPFEKIAPDEAIKACLASSKANEFTPRFLFNLARAYHKLASDPDYDADARRSALRSARLAYEDANRRGYKIALGHLAVLLETGDGKETNLPAAIDLLKRGAEQEQEFAMYVLGVHYRYGIGVKRNPYEAFELFRRAGEKGYIPAKVEAGDALINRRPLWNPRRGVELLQEAAGTGSTRAQLLLAATYSRGAMARKTNENVANQVRVDLGLALLWYGRLAEAGDIQAQAILAERMQNGLGLSASEPEASERYWRLAAQNGDSNAQVTFADRLRRGFVLVKQEYGPGEAIELLKRAQAQGSAQAALALAQIYRNGELGQNKDAREAVTHAFAAMELAVLSDQAPAFGEPFPEMAAAHMLAEMSKTGEAVDSGGGTLLTAEEVDRIEHYYGKVDPSSKQVRIRRLAVPLTCGFGGRVFNRQTRDWDYEYQWTVRKPVWVWDWGRIESPTEFQFRTYERETGCSKNDVMRRTLIDIYNQAKKNEVPFADLVEQKIKTAMGTYAEPPARKSNTRRRRGRR
jgi:TPR repeat protein